MLSYAAHFQLHRSALIFASHEGHIDIVRLLLEKGTDPNQQATVSLRVQSQPAIVIMSDSAFVFRWVGHP